MTAIPRKYITDAKNQKQAVIVDLETFNRRRPLRSSFILSRINTGLIEP
jgi:hypothetical protein